MTIATVRNLFTDGTPLTRVDAVNFLRSASETIKELSPVYLEGRKGQIVDREYEDQKASQLLDGLADLICAEMLIDAWFADLGTRGCSEGSCTSVTS